MSDYFQRNYVFELVVKELKPYWYLLLLIHIELSVAPICMYIHINFQNELREVSSKKTMSKHKGAKFKQARIKEHSEQRFEIIERHQGAFK